MEQKQLAASLAEIVNLPVQQSAQSNCVGAPRLHENSGSPGSVYADKRFAVREKKKLKKKFRVHVGFQLFVGLEQSVDCNECSIIPGWSAQEIRAPHMLPRKS